MLLNYNSTSHLGNPFWGAGELTRIAKEFNRVNRHFDRMATVSRHASLEIGWEVAEDEIVISAELPGYSADSVTVELTQDRQLTLAGSRETVGDSDDETTYLRRERQANSFTRSLRLPYRVDADSVNADFANGILTITLPRAEADKPRQIAVKAS